MSNLRRTRAPPNAAATSAASTTIGPSPPGPQPATSPSVSRSLRGALASRSLLPTLPRTTTDHVCPSCFLGWIVKGCGLHREGTHEGWGRSDWCITEAAVTPPPSGHEEGAPLQARSRFLLTLSPLLLIRSSFHHCVFCLGDVSPSISLPKTTRPLYAYHLFDLLPEWDCASDCILLRPGDRFT
jgi:hypothetical protein